MGKVAYHFVLGAFVTGASLTESFDASPPLTLPPGWETSVQGGGQPWRVLAGSSDSAPNALLAAEPATSGTAEVVSPSITITSSAARLTFRQSLDLEADDVDLGLAYDGGVLEVSIDHATFTDILDAGGVFVTGGYAHTIDSYADNPLPGRKAWSGNSGGYVTTEIALPPALAGKEVRFRWRIATDTENFFGGTGWRIDTISLLDGRYACYSPLVAPVLFDFKASAEWVSFSLLTISGQHYTVEVFDGFSWTELDTFVGDGSLETVTDIPTTQQRFYRVRSP
jgi:hypothetical protein